MINYLIRRTITAVFTLLVISIISFVIIQLPEGDVVDQYVQNRTADRTILSDEDLAEMRETLGLNNPAIIQWWDWLVPVVTKGDLGQSYVNHGWTGRGYTSIPVNYYIEEKLPFTIYLSLFTMIITWAFAIPIGIYSAMRQHSMGDYIFTFLGFTGLAIPDFLLAIVLMYVFFAYFDLSVGGLFSGDYLDAPWSISRVADMLQHLIIPGLVLGTSGTAGLIRVMRNNLLDELTKPYVVTARSKGLSSWKVVVKYPVRLAINPFISGIGAMLPALVSGSIIVSIVLSLPTLGPIFLEATMTQDGPLAGAIVLLLAVLTVLGTLISDITLVLVDPRIKLTGSGTGSSSAT